MFTSVRGLRSFTPIFIGVLGGFSSKNSLGLSSCDSRCKDGHALPKHLFQKAKPYIDDPILRKGVPLAISGKTPVYLPRELPIVLKQSGSPQNQERLKKMKEAREICEKNQYTHLVIPRARIYEDFIVEDRLPIEEHEIKEVIELYLENKEAFTDSIQEFVHFLFQCDLYDIAGNTQNPYNVLSKAPLGRYDNIALFLEKGVGKIGLIDLEKFSIRSLEISEAEGVVRCTDAICLFPCHFEAIMITVRGLCPNIDKYRVSLENVRDESLKRFKIAYEDHLLFIKTKGITLKNPTEVLRLEKAKEQALKKTIENRIRGASETQYGWFEGILEKKTPSLPEWIFGEVPDATFMQFHEKGFPIILESTYQFLQELLEARLEQRAPISRQGSLLELRSLRFDPRTDNFYGKLLHKVCNELKTLPTLKDSYYLQRDIADFIVRIIFDVFQKEGVIYYYNPLFGYGEYTRICLFL